MTAPPPPASRRPRLRTPLLLLAIATALPARADAQDLTGLGLEQLLDVRITGASKYEQKLEEVAASASVITRAEMAAFGWRTIEQALGSLPGIHVGNDRQYSYIGTRGFSIPGDYTTRVLITINGNRLNDPVYDAGPLGRAFPLDLDLVERIEFVPGPGGAVYGQNAMFGVVNVVTRAPVEVGGELAAGVQQPQRLREGRASWGGRLGEQTSLLLSAAGMRARGQDLVLDFGAARGPTTVRGLDGERDREFFARLTHRAWSVDVVHGQHRKDDPTGAYVSDPLAAGEYQGDAYTVGQLQFEDRFADARLDVSARLFGGAERYRSELAYDGSRYRFPADGRWRGAELRLLWTGVAGHKLMAGAEWQDNFRQDQNVLDLADAANDLRIRHAGRRGGLYLQDEWRIVPDLTATLGLRADRGTGSATRSSPRAALLWSPGETTVLKALFGRAHRQPNSFERDYDDGFAQVANPALKGETIDTWELVGDQRLAGGWSLRASAYRWKIQNLITLGPVPGNEDIQQYRSGVPVRARGLELSAQRHADAGLHLRGSVSLQGVERTDGSLVPNAPRLLARVGAVLPLPGWGLRAAVDWRFTGATRTLDGERLGGHAVTALNLVTDRLAPGLELGLHVANLFDRRYRVPGADSNWQRSFEQDGRSLGLRAVWRY